MNRSALDELINWKNTPNHKPLIIKGARQVGKTWLMRNFGQIHYKETVYLNFEKSSHLKTIFQSDFNTERILTALKIESGKTISPQNTLIIFDEIQEAPKAITSLKYFNEEAPEYDIIAAGSLLGVSLHAKESFPVGKVEFLNLYPLTFYEFLDAMQEQPLLQLLESGDWEMIKAFNQKYRYLLRLYYYIGGMPEVVSHYTQNKDFNTVRNIQNNILATYEQDFSKHAPNDIVPRIRMLWNSIPSQLSKENKKFIYNAVKKGSRAKDFELALQWLIDCGLIHKITRILKPGLPLKAYEDFDAFKLFTVDIGLLSAMSNLNVKTLLEGNTIFEEYKGALTEQYILQQLKTEPNMSIYYWSSANSSAEIDFVTQYNDRIFPIEVKASENLQAKSLKSFYQKYPETYPIRTSMSDYRKETWLTNIPLYGINKITQQV